jgi:hypothetical protein
VDSSLLTKKKYIWIEKSLVSFIFSEEYYSHFEKKKEGSRFMIKRDRLLSNTSFFGFFALSSCTYLWSFFSFLLLQFLLLSRLKELASLHTAIATTTAAIHFYLVSSEVHRLSWDHPIYGLIEGLVLISMWQKKTFPSAVTFFQFRKHSSRCKFYTGM